MRHQQLGREIAEYYDRFGFFFDTRTGKTPLALSIMYDDLQRHPDHKWLVVCPLILIDNAWLEDAQKFVPELKVVSCHASTKDKRLKLINSSAQIYVTNTESFAAYKEHFKGFYGCFVDESSDMKSYKSKQSEALVDFSQTVKRWYLLSGTPAPNSEVEYFMQLRSIDYYCVPEYITHFKQHYFTDISFNQFEKLVLRPDKKDELLGILKKYSIFVDKEDVLTTPGRTFHEIEFKMPAELKTHYDTLVEEMYVEVSEERTLTTTSAGAKCNKLRQVASGFVIDTKAIKENKFYNEDAVEVYMLSDYRFTHLYSLLDELGPEQVIIWCNYHKEFEVIQEKLGSSCACVYGATSLAEKNKAIQDFKAGRVQYLIANPASADKGLTLTNCHICIYFSLNYSYELFKQSMERIYGSIEKQPKHCEYYVFIARGTIDRAIYSDVLSGKRDASTALLNHLKGDI